jgi:acetate kinase
MSPVRHILTINAGSSSIKFALFDAGSALQRIVKGSSERIGLSESKMTVQPSGSSDAESRPVSAPDHAAAARELMQWIAARSDSDALSAIGHRLVHGGPKYSAPVRLDATIIEELRKLSPFDPEHMPHELKLAEALQRQYPKLPQVACFDTAFHHAMPRVAQLLPLPRRYQAQGLRRYGFHGLSYAFLMQELQRVAGADAARGRVILAHLGNGASLAAVRAGESVDTSMSFTPASGIPMSTRAGDLDPGLVWYLARADGLDARAFNTLINTQCGLLGVSESSPDMRDLLDREDTDPRAREAVDLFCYQVKKWVGAFAAALGGLDTLVFSAGIGERAAPVRARICAGLEFLGIALDPARNAAHAALISPASGRVAVRVIPTDEEQMLAQLVGSTLWPPL